MDRLLNLTSNSEDSLSGLTIAVIRGRLSLRNQGGAELRPEVRGLLATFLFSAFDFLAEKCNTARTRVTDDSYLASGASTDPGRSAAAACGCMGLEMISFCAEVARRTDLEIGLAVSVALGKASVPSDAWAKLSEIDAGLDRAPAYGRVYFPATSADSLRRDKFLAPWLTMDTAPDGASALLLQERRSEERRRQDSNSVLQAVALVGAIEELDAALDGRINDWILARETTLRQSRRISGRRS